MEYCDSSPHNLMGLAPGYAVAEKPFLHSVKVYQSSKLLDIMQEYLKLVYCNKVLCNMVYVIMIIALFLFFYKTENISEINIVLNIGISTPS